MAYGRLEVFYPDGAFKTFLLSDPNVSIGRSAGNMIALDVEGISRYHVSLTYTEGLTNITDLDSANGTFVDGERLKANEASPLMGGEEIQIGEVRVIYHNFDDTPTRPIVVPEETTRRIEIEAGKFTVDLFEPEQPVSPGAHISAQLTITNTGETSERYTVEVGGLPADWVRIDRRELEIAPGKAGDVVVNFKPRRRPDSAPGDYAVTTIVRPRSNPLAELRTHFTLHVLAYGGFGMALEQRNVRTGEQFRLHLHNQGSAVLPITITPRPLSDAITAKVNPSRLTLAPGQRLMVAGEARAKSARIFGDPTQSMVDLVVRSGDAARFTAAARVHVTERPPLPGWARFVGLGVVLTLILLTVVGLFVLLSPPAPPVVGSETPTAEVTEEIAGFIVQDFRVDPPTVARFVLQDLTITWDIPGAITARISGLEGFTTSPLQADYPASGTVTVPGIWQSPLPLTISVTAENAAYEIVTSAINVEVVPILCTAVTGDVALYAAPDGRGQIVATVQSSTQAEITGRDLNGGWLRVALTGGASGWGRVNSFSCPDPNLISVLLIVPDVATAVPETPGTLAPTATAGG